MIKGTVVQLKSVEKYDIPKLYKLFTESSGGMLSTTYKEVTLDNFIFKIFGNIKENDGAKVFCILYEDNIIGFITLNDISILRQCGHVEHLVIEEKFRGKRYAVDAVLALINYAFNSLNLHRMDCHIHGDNEGMKEEFFKYIPGIVHEGVDREWGYKDGKWLDRHRWGLLKRDFYTERED